MPPQVRTDKEAFSPAGIRRGGRGLGCLADFGEAACPHAAWLDGDDAVQGRCNWPLTAPAGKSVV